MAVASPTIKSLAANVQGHTWNSLELFEVLVRAADSDSAEVKSFVREMLDKAVKISAELVHMGLLQVPVSPEKFIWLDCADFGAASPMGRDSTRIHSASAEHVPGGPSEPPIGVHEDLADRADVLDERFPRLLQ